MEFLMKNKKNILLVLLVFLILVAVGYGSYYYKNHYQNKKTKTPSSTSSPNPEIIAQQQAFTEKIVSGVIKEIDKKQIILRLYDYSGGGSKTIKITDQTKYLKTPPGGGIYEAASIDEFTKDTQVLVVLVGKRTDQNYEAAEIRLIPLPK